MDYVAIVNYFVIGKCLHVCALRYASRDIYHPKKKEISPIFHRTASAILIRQITETPHPIRTQAQEYTKDIIISDHGTHGKKK